MPSTVNLLFKLFWPPSCTDFRVLSSELHHHSYTIQQPQTVTLAATYVIAAVLNSAFCLMWLDVDVLGSVMEKDDLHKKVTGQSVVC